MWFNGELRSLVSKGRCIQKPLRTGSRRKDDDEAIARTFRDLIFNGKVRDAMHFLSRKTSGRVLQLIPDITEGEETMQSVREILKDKHPLATPATPSTILDTEDDPEPVNLILIMN